MIFFAQQINEIQNEGADLVRVSCPDESSSKALKEISKHVDIPIIADIHFHYKRAIEAASNGASCLRINPGNIGNEKKIQDVIISRSKFLSEYIYKHWVTDFYTNL